MLVVLTAVLTLCLFTCDARLVQDITMFDVIKNISDTVNETDGPLPNSRAYEFTDTTGHLIAPANISTMFAKQAFLVNQFTVKAYLLPADRSDGGTIIFLSRDKKKGGVAFNIVFKLTRNGFEIGTTFYVASNPRTFECEFENVQRSEPGKSEWLHLEVRVHILERLVRCIITTSENKKFYRHTKQPLDDAPFERFPTDTNLRLAQEFTSVDEGLLKITERFVGKLQDVVISFGDPNCTINIEDNYVTAAPTQKVCPTANLKYTCVDNEGEERIDGAEWEEGKWEKCKCIKGKTRCTKSVRRCIHGGKDYLDGDDWYDEQCYKCECSDGVVKCRSTDRVKKDSGCDSTCEPTSCKQQKDRCYCPEGKLLHDGKCISPLACPCFFDNREYAAGQHRVGCKYCKCLSGKGRCYDNVYC